MSQDNQLHPSVVAFKQFMNKHPKLIKEIRKKGESWQEYYEKWVLLGEDDPMWQPYKETEEEKTTQSKQHHELFKQLTKLMNYIDFNKVQQQVNQLSDTINMIQDLLQNYSKQQDATDHTSKRKQPFHPFRD